MINNIMLGGIVLLIILISIGFIKYLYQKHSNAQLSKSLFVVIAAIYALLIICSIAYLIFEHPVLSYFHHSFIL